MSWHREYCTLIKSRNTFGVGIITNKGKILANEKDTYVPPLGWGINPTEAKKHHEKVCEDVTNKALREAGIKTKDIDLISVAVGPGLPPCLLVGLKQAKKIAKEIRKPIVPVSHILGHLEIGRLLCKCKDPAMLYVSGGNTQVIAFEGGRYRIFGETLDIAVGNLIDSFARLSGLQFPGGPKVEKLAKKGNYIELPYSVKGMDVCFGGLLTNLKQKIKSKKYKIEDLCFSLQETAFAMLVEVSERAMAHCNKNELLLTGGVAANKRLQEMCNIMCKERDARFYTVPLEYAGDNGTMIAWQGILKRKEAAKEYNKIDIKQKWRADEVEVIWR